MDNENELPLSKVLENILHSFFKIFGDLGSLAKLEAQLAKRSAVIILFLSIILLALLTTTWLCLLGVIVAYLLYFKFSLLASLAIATALNVLLALVVCVIITRYVKNLSFRATRKQLNNTKSLFKGSFHGKPETRN